MKNYDVVVIGAGNAGLTAAASLAQKGVGVLVLERHNIPGGCATSFVRGRFEFEIALHQLSGLGTPEFPGPVRSLFDSLGVTDKLEFIEMTDLYRVVVPGVIDVTLKPNREAIVRELSERFPKEKDSIERFFDLIYRFFMELITAAGRKGDNPPTRDEFPLYFSHLFRNAQEVLDEYFTDPYLKLVVAAYWPYAGLPPRLLSFSYLAGMLFGYIEFKPYHVLGGSQAMSNALADVIIRNGGEIRFNCPVKRIVMKDGRAAGVVTQDGETISARYVVSNAFRANTYLDLFDPAEIDPSVIDGLRGKSVGPSALCLYMGFDCEPDEMGITESSNFLYPDADMDAAYDQMRSLSTVNNAMMLSCYDKMHPNFSPEGSCQAALVNLKYTDPWLRVEPHRYFEEKFKWAEIMLKDAEKVFPNIRGHIEEIDISTPLTHARYLGHINGSIYGFDQYMKDQPPFVTPKSPIAGLFETGASVAGGGFQPTLENGAKVARVILREMGA